MNKIFPRVTSFHIKKSLCLGVIILTVYSLENNSLTSIWLFKDISIKAGVYNSNLIRGKKLVGTKLICFTNSKGAHVSIRLKSQVKNMWALWAK